MDNVLDIGCGSGAVLLELAKTAPEPAVFVGVDISEIAISIAKQVFRAQKVSANLLQANAESLPCPDGSFTKVFALGVLEHSPEPDMLLREFRRVLTKDGELYLTTASSLSTIYIARRLREFGGFWPYGFQTNYLPQRFLELVGRHFNVKDYLIFQTAFDFPFSATIDRILRIVVPHWGRYIAVRASIKG